MMPRPQPLARFMAGGTRRPGFARRSAGPGPRRRAAGLARKILRVLTRESFRVIAGPWDGALRGAWAGGRETHRCGRCGGHPVSPVLAGDLLSVGSAANTLYAGSLDGSGESPAGELA